MHRSKMQFSESQRINIHDHPHPQPRPPRPRHLPLQRHPQPPPRPLPRPPHPHRSERRPNAPRLHRRLQRGIALPAAGPQPGPTQPLPPGRLLRQGGAAEAGDSQRHKRRSRRNQRTPGIRLRIHHQGPLGRLVR